LKKFNGTSDLILRQAQDEGNVLFSLIVMLSLSK